MDFYKGTIPILDDEPSAKLLWEPGAEYGKGYEERDYDLYPEEMMQHPSEMDLYDESEWDALYDSQEEQESSLEHIFLRGGKPAFVNLDQNGHGYCFPAGTRIRMADGTQKNIEDVKLLDRVLTAEGNLRRVMQCHVREHKGQLAVVKTFGHGHLKLTPNHSVLTKRGYVPAGELTANDWIVMPRYAPQESVIIQTAEHVQGVRRRIANVAGVAQWETRMPSDSDASHKAMPDFIRMTPGVGRIFGLWLAEGHIDKTTGSVIWSFNVNETDTLAAEVVNLVQSEWGMEAYTKPGPGPNVTQVVLQGVMWCQLFKSLCGTGSGTKKPHADLMAGPKDFLEGMFWGWMSGDGCSRNVNKKRGYSHVHETGATISHNLALAMYDIANAIGLSPVIQREKPQKNRHAKTRQIVWKVLVNPNPSSYRHNYRVEVEESRMWRKVRHVEFEDFDGTVFNIGVAGDNSYVAEGVGVHNCWAYSTGHALMLSMLADNRPLTRLNPHSVASIIKNGADQGGWCGLSAQKVSEIGMAPEGNGEGQWPLHSRDYQRHYNEACKKRMADFKITEDWTDLTRREYDRNLTEKQLATALFNNIPCPTDFNHWTHSVCSLRWVRIERGSWGGLILNSWKGWGRFGLGVLRGSKAIPNGAIGVRNVGRRAAQRALAT
jgi:hypothetical protein